MGVIPVPRQPRRPASAVRGGMDFAFALPFPVPAPFPAPPPIRRLARVDGLEASDEALMLAYAGGDAMAFEQLYARHRTRLYRFLLRQLRDGALADDLFQDIWQRVIAARAGWTPDATFSSWLYRIAHNRLADHWRALQHRPPAPGRPGRLAEHRGDRPRRPARRAAGRRARRRLAPGR